MASSVTTWISRFRNSDGQVDRRLLTFYEGRISQLIQRKMRRVPQRVKDESDIKLDSWLACLTLLRSDRHIERECNRAGLWALLKLSAGHRVIEYVRYLRRRGEVSGPKTAFPAVAGVVNFDQLIDQRPLTEVDLMVDEEIDAFVDRLDDDLRATARLKLEGLTLSAIARELKISKSTIERRLRMIRDLWNNGSGPSSS